jgi:hypothetical protein
MRLTSDIKPCFPNCEKDVQINLLLLYYSISIFMSTYSIAQSVAGMQSVF